MKFTDSIWINATPHKVWISVASPEVWPRLYAKAGRCSQVSPEGGLVGSLYDMELVSGSRTTLIRCEVLGICSGRMIAVRWTLGQDVPYIPGWIVQFAYELKDEGFRTKVTERVQMTDCDFGINLLVKVMGWLVYPFRKAAGKTSLQKLKGIVEGNP